MPSPRGADARRLLIFEPDGEGHALEWLEHLIRFADHRTQIFILAAPGLCTALGRTIALGTHATVRTLPLTPQEQALCLKRPLALAAFARWWIVRRYMKQTGAQQAFFLTIDFQALPLALGLEFGRGRSASGILFRPSVHYASLGPYRPSLGERLRDWRKDFLYRLMLRNRSLTRVLSLDPFFPMHARRNYRHGAKVEALPDPAQQPLEVAAVQPGDDYVPPGRTGFLLFGYLAERKGLLPVLDSLALLTPEVASQVALLLAGRVDPNLTGRIKQRSDALAQSQPGLWLKIDDRRLNEAELASLVKRSDVVLAPYQRFVGSSGVLLWAARSGRPVLAQDFGLIGRLTRDHGLGLSVDSFNPADIARQITRMVEQGPAAFFDRDAAMRFADAQTPQRFACLVLSV